MQRSLIWLLGLALLTTFLILKSHSFPTKHSIATPNLQTFYVATDGQDANDGSLLHPWATIHHAAEVLQAGQTLYIRGGIYPISQQIRVKHSGTTSDRITYAAYPEETVIIDAKNIHVPPPSGNPPYAHDQGAFQLENVSYITVRNLTIINSHNSGLTSRNSHHITLVGNRIENTFAPGIGVWHDQTLIPQHIKILGNSVMNANDAKLGYEGFQLHEEPPHEAISLGGINQFEVAYNLVRDSQKEGIDIKGASKHGTVHHNYIHHLKRQGLYVDSWSDHLEAPDPLEDIEVFQNVVHDCQGAGFVLSVEGGVAARNIRVHHNLLYDNWGTGILFGRWGRDGLRENIRIDHNTVHHNGHGKPDPGKAFYWITGGLYFFSSNLRSVEVSRNIFSQNAGFQIGYSDRYLTNNSNIHQVFQQKAIQVKQNLLHDTSSIHYPIYAGWVPDNWAAINSFTGEQSKLADPRFVNATGGNFYLQSDSPALDNSSDTYMGAFPTHRTNNFWWKESFPPQLHGEL